MFRIRSSGTASERYYVLDYANAAFEAEPSLENVDPEEGVLAFRIDPLSGDTQPGLSDLSHNLETIERIERVEPPISDGYWVDRVSEFSDWSALTGYEQPSAEFAAVFIGSVREFMIQNELMSSNSDRAEAEAIHSEELNELGLDFFRQHYRRVKEEAIEGAKQPKSGELEAWLRRTTANRTDAEVWWDRTYDTDHQTISSMKELLFLQTVYSLNLVGPEIWDLEPFQNCLRLNSLTLTETDVDGLQALAGIPSLRSLYLKLASPDLISTLSGLAGIRTLSLEGMPVPEFGAIAQMKHLKRLELRECNFSPKAMEKFVAARPKVNVVVDEPAED